MPAKGTKRAKAKGEGHASDISDNIESDDWPTWSRLQEQRMPESPVATMLTLNTPPLANLQRYDALRNAQPQEASPESDHA